MEEVGTEDQNGNAAFFMLSFEKKKKSIFNVCVLKKSSKTRPVVSRELLE